VHSITQRLKRERLAKRIARWYRAGTFGYPQWEKILRADQAKWDEVRRNSKGTRKVLIATSVGAFLPGTMVESTLSVALTLRGAEVHVFLCDSVLPACLECDVNWWIRDQERFVQHGPAKDLCGSCFSPAKKMYESLGVVVHRYSECLTAEEIQHADSLSKSISIGEIEDYTTDHIAVGEHALAGALRFFARGTLDGEPFAEDVLRRYFKASLLTMYATQGLLRKHHFDSAVFHHGIYVPQGLIGEVCRREEVRVINWNPAYRSGCFIFSHGDTYHHTLMWEPVSTWENMVWTQKMESDVMEYLRSRWYGTRDWIFFHENPEIDLGKIERELGIDFSKPCVGLLTNVFWDAQLHYPANAFPSMMDWVLQTIGHFRKRQDLQLIIRIHPAEIKGFVKSRQLVADEIRRAFPDLPQNVFLIPPESPIGTYAVMERCNAVLIFGTKTGVELTSMGIPVIVAGEAWIRNKGITMDAGSRDEYFRMLEALPLKERLPDDVVRRARKYAYHFFFRRMIPLEMIEPRKGYPPYKVSPGGIEDFRLKRSLGLDVVCNGILAGSDFVYPAELEEVSHVEAQTAPEVGHTR